MYEVSKCAPQEALRDLDRAFNNFFRGLSHPSERFMAGSRFAGKSKQKTGFPKFKKKGIDDSFRLTGSMHVSKALVVLPRIGRIRTKEETERFKGCILSVTVSKEADPWFASFSVERKRGEYNRTVQDSAMEVDVGINSFCVLSDGTKIESPKPLEHTLRLLKQRSKQHSRKKIGSVNRKKSALRLACLHRRIRNKRKDFIHKLSTQLAKTKPVIVVRDLNARGMMQNRHLSRHIADSGWSQFLTMLIYKTKWYGSSLLKAPKFYPSSKTCSAWGNIKPELSLKKRQFVCKVCAASIDRDENAALNLKHLFIPLDRETYLTGRINSHFPILRDPVK